MHGCALLIFLALASFLLLPVADPTGLPIGFLVGLVVGGLVGLLGVYNAGWNDHVALVRDRAESRAEHEAKTDRR